MVSAFERRSVILRLVDKKKQEDNLPRQQSSRGIFFFKKGIL
jgi:hypothetical protein